MQWNGFFADERSCVPEFGCLKCQFAIFSAVGDDKGWIKVKIQLRILYSEETNYKLWSYKYIFV
jgi:hypothetical protein